MDLDSSAPKRSVSDQKTGSAVGESQEQMTDEEESQHMEDLMANILEESLANEGLQNPDHAAGTSTSTKDRSNKPFQEAYWWTTIGPVMDHPTESIVFTLVVESNSGPVCEMPVKISPKSEDYDASEKTVDEVMLEALELLSQKGHEMTSLMAGMTQNAEALVRLRGFQSTSYKYYESEVALEKTSITNGCRVFMHPRSGSGWDAKKWNSCRSQTRRTRAAVQSGELELSQQPEESRPKSSRKWGGADPEKFKRLFRIMGRPQVRRLLERTGNLRRYSTAPNLDCGWACMSLAINPEDSWATIDLADIYTETIRAHTEIYEGHFDEVLGDAEQVAIMKTQSAERITQLTHLPASKKHPCAEHCDFDALSLMLGLRFVLWTWNSVEKSFARTVMVTDRRDPSNRNARRVRESIYSTIYILYSWNGYNQDEAENNHFDLLLPLENREAQMLQEHEGQLTASNIAGAFQQPAFNPNAWLFPGLKEQVEREKFGGQAEDEKRDESEKEKERG
jgi:hypothetical protein